MSGHVDLHFPFSWNTLQSIVLGLKITDLILLWRILLLFLLFFVISVNKTVG